MQKRKITRPKLFSPAEIAFLAIAPLTLAAPFWIFPSFRVALSYAMDFGGECSFSRTLSSNQDVAEMNQNHARIHRESRIEKSDEVAGLDLWSTPEGKLWAPKGLKGVPFLLAEQSTQIYGKGERRVKAGDVVLDCGANVGTFTQEALSAGASRVIAIEPSQRNIECLRRNFAREIQDGRVVLIPKGVWHKSDILTFKVYDNSALDSFVMATRFEENRAPQEMRLDVTTVDQIVAELKLDRVDFIKMDIEGAERNAIQGSSETIKKFHPRMSIATENLADDPSVLPALVLKMWPGYRKECGRCSLNEKAKLRPDVVFFY